MNKYIVTYVIYHPDQTHERDVLIIKEWTVDGAMVAAEDTLDAITSFDETYEIYEIIEIKKVQK